MTQLLGPDVALLTNRLAIGDAGLLEIANVAGGCSRIVDGHFTSFANDYTSFEFRHSGSTYKFPDPMVKLLRINGRTPYRDSRDLLLPITQPDIYDPVSWECGVFFKDPYITSWALCRAFCIPECARPDVFLPKRDGPSQSTLRLRGNDSSRVTYATLLMNFVWYSQETDMIPMVMDSVRLLLLQLTALKLSKELKGRRGKKLESKRKIISSFWRDCYQRNESKTDCILRKAYTEALLHCPGAKRRPAHLSQCQWIAALVDEHNRPPRKALTAAERMLKYNQRKHAVHVKEQHIPKGAPWTRPFEKDPSKTHRSNRVGRVSSRSNTSAVVFPSMCRGSRSTLEPSSHISGRSSKRDIATHYDDSVSRNICARQDEKIDVTTAKHDGAYVPSGLHFPDRYERVIDIIPGMYGFGVTTAKVDCKGCHHETHRVQPPRERTRVEADLDRIVTTTMDYDALCEMFPTLSKVLAPLRRRDEFEKLLTGTIDSALTRGTSRNMYRHAEDLMNKYHVLRPATMTETKAVLNVFTVPKKNHLLRLVQDCRKLNRIMARPPKMPLPSIHEVIEYILSQNFVWTCDAKSYFYQFGVDDDVGAYFCTRLGAARGSFIIAAMTRMAMGWSWAPFIAQSTSNALASGLGVAWLDNFIFAAKTSKDLIRSSREFLSRCRRADIQLDNYCPTASTRALLLGFDFDLARKRFRLDPEFIQNMPHVDDVTTVRTLFALTGSLTWASYAKRDYLCKRYKAINILRRAVPKDPTDVAAWDTPLTLSKSEKELLQEWHDVHKPNPWVNISEFREPSDLGREIWSDASDDMCGFTVAIQKTLLAAANGPAPTWAGKNIFLKESFAVNVAMLWSLPKERGGSKFDQLNVDNMGLHHALTRKLSSVDVVNEMMNSWLESGMHWRSTWVPTDQQRGDPLTRGVTPDEYLRLGLYDPIQLAKWRAAHSGRRGPANNNNKKDVLCL